MYLMRSLTDTLVMLQSGHFKQFHTVKNPRLCYRYTQSSNRSRPVVQMKVRRSTKLCLMHTFSGLEALKCRGGRSKFSVLHIQYSYIYLTAEWLLFVSLSEGKWLQGRTIATVRGLHKNTRRRGEKKKHRNALNLYKNKSSFTIHAHEGSCENAAARLSTLQMIYIFCQTDIVHLRK